MEFNKDLFKQVFDEECSRHLIREGGVNRVKILLEDVDRMSRRGDTQLTAKQQQIVINKMNELTTDDTYIYCLQSYYDLSPEEVTESFYSSGIERTAAYFNKTGCEPAYSGEGKQDYIETVLFRCFSDFFISKGTKPNDIYRFFIRFGCIFNPRANIIVLLFNILSNNEYFLRSGNLDEGSEYGYTDQNIFSEQGSSEQGSSEQGSSEQESSEQGSSEQGSSEQGFRDVNFTSRMMLQITTSSFTNVAGQPFMMNIDYGSIITLDAHPYAFVLPTLFYMRDRRVNDYEGTKRRFIQIQRRQQEEQRRQQENMEGWMEARMQLGSQGGGRKKSKKYKKMQHKNKSNRYRRKSKSRIIRRSINRTSRRK